MLFTFPCPSCRTRLEADSSLSGGQVACPHCQAPVAVPEGKLGPGTTLGDFRLERLLGKGGMGEVYLGTQLSVDRQVAVKVLPPWFAGNPEAVQRFLHEGRLAARLDHANIVTVYASGEDDGVFFLAMAFVDGESLDQRLKREGRLPEPEALGIVRALAEALAYAWEEFQLLHRDLKPANIMIDRRGRIFLMDLGLAKSLGEESGMTISGTVLGTPQYMSPEQAMGLSRLTVATDIYSLGATLYHLVAGVPPFAGDTTMAVLQQHLQAPLPPPRERNPELSLGCSRLIERMMAKKPEERYTDWRALVTDVDRVLAGADLVPVEPAVPAVSRTGTANRARSGRGIAGSRMAAGVVRQAGAGTPPAGGSSAARPAIPAWRSPWVWGTAAAALVVVALVAALALRGRGDGAGTAREVGPERTDRASTGVLGAGVAAPAPATPPPAAPTPTVPAVHVPPPGPAALPPAAAEGVPAAPGPAAGAIAPMPVPLPKAPDGFLYGYYIVSKASYDNPQEYVSRVGAFTNVAVVGHWSAGYDRMARALAEADIGVILRSSAPSSRPIDQASLLALCAADVPQPRMESPRAAELLIEGIHRQYLGLPILVALGLDSKSVLWSGPNPVPAGTDLVIFYDYERAPGEDVGPRILSDFAFLRRAAPRLPILICGRSLRGEDRYRNPLSADEARGWAAAAVEAGAAGLLWVFYDQEGWDGLKGASSVPGLIEAHAQIAAELGIRKLSVDAFRKAVLQPGDTTPAAAPASAPEAAASAAPAADLSPLARSILAGRAAEALQAWRGRQDELEKGLAPAVRQAMTAQFEALAGMERQLLAALRADVGKTVELDLAKERITCEIREVGATGVRVYQLVKQGQGTGKLVRTVPLSDLSLAERLRRLGEGDAPPLSLQRGLLALEAGRPDTARRLFAKAGGPLGEALAAEIDARRDSARERAAEDALADLLRQISTSTKLDDKEGVIAGIRKHCGDEPKRVQSARKALAEFQEDWGETAAAKEWTPVVREALTFGVPLVVPDLALEMVWVAPGSFGMGSNEGQADEKPVHEVSISRGFWLGKYELTQAQYQTVVGANPSQFAASGAPLPVDAVSWHLATAFCAQLTERERLAERLPTGYEFRLPTEAEWEYAARGGRASDGRAYSGSDDPYDVAWHRDNSGGKTHPVGGKLPNELGLCDMTGNLEEWCLDWYDEGYYRRSPACDPLNLERAENRTTRGGSWCHGAERLARRLCRPATYGGNHMGLRVCLGPRIETK